MVSPRALDWAPRDNQRAPRRGRLPAAAAPADDIARSRWKRTG